MNSGMLWFDNDPKTELPEKVQKAAVYYRKKYGQAPDICFVNPQMMESKKLKMEKIEVKTSPSIMPHHFWIGSGVNNE